MVLMIASLQSTLHVAGPILRPTESLRMTPGGSVSVVPVLLLWRRMRMLMIPSKKSPVALPHSLVQTVMRRLPITT
jgi:hypothetical protein